MPRAKSLPSDDKGRKPDGIVLCAQIGTECTDRSAMCTIQQGGKNPGRWLVKGRGIIRRWVPENAAAHLSGCVAGCSLCLCGSRQGGEVNDCGPRREVDGTGLGSEADEVNLSCDQHSSEGAKNDSKYCHRLGRPRVTFVVEGLGFIPHHTLNFSVYCSYFYCSPNKPVYRMYQHIEPRTWVPTCRYYNRCCISQIWKFS